MRIGSELFIERDDTPEIVRERVDVLADHGMTLARLFAFWDLVEVADDVWKWEVFDALFDRAAERGVGVVPTLFAMCPPGWMRLSDGPQGTGGLDDPDVRRRAERYLRHFVGRYAGHAATDSWIPWNEPSLAWDQVPRSPHTLGLFREYLREHYGSVERLNATWYPQHDSFEAVADLPAEAGGPIGTPIARADRARFLGWYVRRMLRNDIEIIRELDAEHPIHLNPHAMASTGADSGQDFWLEADLVDFTGCSAHPVWHAARFPRDRWTQAVGLFAALCRDAHPDRVFWVSELQAGPASFSGSTPGGPTADDLEDWTGEAARRGAQACVYWTLNARSAGGEAGEWALLDQRGRPSPRLERVRQMAGTLRARDVRPNVKVLHSSASLLAGFCFGEGDDPTHPRNTNRNADAAAGAFQVLDDLADELDLEVGFIDESRLARGGPFLDGVHTLVLPDCWCLTPSTIDAIEAFVNDGGTIIADGHVGYLDSHFRLMTEVWSRIDAIFGVELLDYRAEPRIEIPGDTPVPGWFQRFDFGAGKAVASRTWSDGGTAVSDHRHGSGGRAVRIGTHLFQHYFAHHDPATRSLIGQLLQEKTDTA